MKKNVIYAILGVLSVISLANAQTFAPTNASSTAVQKVSAQKAAAQKAKTPAAPTATKASAPAQPEEEADTGRKVIKKMDDVAGKKEKVYDNTYRKVFHFKIVDGDLTIDNDADRSILVFYDNYQIQRGLDNLVRCSIRLYVLNDLTTKISSLGFKLIWPEISTTVQMNQVNPGVRTYKDLMLLGEGCYSMDKVPTIEVNRCRIKGKSQEECADAIKWYQGNK